MIEVAIVWKPLQNLARQTNPSNQARSEKTVRSGTIPGMRLTDHRD